MAVSAKLFIQLSEGWMAVWTEPSVSLISYQHVLLYNLYHNNAFRKGGSIAQLKASLPTDLKDCNLNLGAYLLSVDLELEH
jgi:hypothetical protein